MLKSILLSSVALAAASVPALAQAERIIVSATRTPTAADAVASSVSVVTAADIEARQQLSLPDVLRDVPGLNIVRAGGQGSQTSVFTRGANSNHTKVLVDGIDVADSSTPNGAFDLGKYNAADIAQLEVLRGPSSGLYGSDAIGGVIAIITRSGEGPGTLAARAEGGSFGTFNQEIGLGGEKDGLHYRFTAAHQHSGNTPVTPKSILLPGERAIGDFYDSSSLSTRLGYDVSETFGITFVGRSQYSLNKYTGDGFDLKTFLGFPAFTQNRSSSSQNHGRLSAHLVLGGFDQTLGAAYSSTVTAVADPNLGNARNVGDRVKLDWQGSRDMGYGQTLVLGAETARDAIHRPLSAGVTTNAGFAELQSAIGALNSAVSVRYDDNSRFGNKLTWRIAPSIRIDATATRVKASYGTGFKAPSLQNLFGPFGHNVNLKPETSTGYDIGLDQALGADFTAGITWFHNDISNLIDFGPPPLFNPVNIGKARTQGVESYVEWKASQMFKFRADYTYTEARDARFGTELLRRPRNKVSATADVQFTPALSFAATLLYVTGGSDLDRIAFSPVKSGNYMTLDIAARYALSDTISLFGRIDNLSDTNYQSPSGFLQPGRGVYAGIKATL